MVDAALEQKVLDTPQRQWEPQIHHHDQADDFRRSVRIAEWAGWFSAAGHTQLLAIRHQERQSVPLL
jgi:hypothetical protein